MGTCSTSSNSKGRNPFAKKELFFDEDKEKNNINNINNINNKKEGKLRIYYYGDEAIKSHLDPNSYSEHTIVENGIKYTKGVQLLLNWEYYIFKNITEENNKTISKLIHEDYKTSDFCDVIIITVNTLLDEESILFLNHFQNISDQKSCQPFILFITKKEEKPNVKDLYKLLTNEYFDKRTLYATKYPSAEKEEKENGEKTILNYICKFRSYYNEQGNSFDLNEDNLSNYKFNILLCGKAGTGKSSFINKFLGNKRAKEGEGLSMTHKIVEYTHQEYPISIYDTPGFEDKNTVENVIKLLENLNKELIDARKKINLILYFFQYSERSVFNFEIPLISMLSEYKTKIIFVINFVTESIEKSHYKRIHSIFVDSLEKILPKNSEILIKPINLYQQIDDENETPIIKKEFGLDVLFNTIYEIYKPMKIDTETLKDIKDIKSLLNFFGKNPLYSQFREINDLFISFRSDMINLILYYSTIKLKKKKLIIEEMIDKLKNAYSVEESKDYDWFISKVSSEEEEKKIVDDFFKCIAELKLLKKHINDLHFLSFISDHRVLAVGYVCLTEFEKAVKDNPNVFFNKDKVNLDLILNLCNSLNTAIDSFSLLSKKFENYYLGTKKEEEDVSIEIDK